MHDIPSRNENSKSPGKPGRESTRRRFLKTAGGGALTACMLPGVLLEEAAAGLFSASPVKRLLKNAPEARYYVAADAAGADCRVCHLPEDKLGGRTRFRHDQAYVKCRLCAQNCFIRPGARGECGARVNDGGVLKSLVYGRPVSVHVDPIEKKPFYHFLPGASAFSLATAGCPFHCAFCQNWEISQAKPEAFDGPYVPPDQIAGAAAGRNVPVIAYTYNEPTVFFEYMVDIARAAREKGIKNVLVSCGFMNAEPLSELCAVLDAIKIDLKGITPEFYRDVCDARLGPVLSSIRQIAKSGVHLEIVNLVVPTLNDAEASLTELCKWVASEIGTDVPLHFTRFHPDYRLRNLPPTPVSTLEAAYDIAKAQGIRYPFVGNVPGHPGNHTLCPECGKAVLKRSGFFLTENHITNGRCDFCGASIAGVWR